MSMTKLDAVNEQQQIKHVGSFLLLIMLCTMRPVVVWPDFSIFFELLTLIALGLLLLYKINLTLGFKKVWDNFAVELSLVALYHVVCLISLYLNSERYDDIGHLIRAGLIYPVITASFAGAILLFVLPQSSRGPSLSRYSWSIALPWVYFSLLGLMTFWQSIDYESAKVVGQFFVTSEVWPVVTVNGFFAISTDAGPVLAIASVTLFCIALRLPQEMLTVKVLFLVSMLMVVLLIGGLVTGSRSFLFALLVACGYFGYQTVRQNPRVVGSFVLLLVALFYWVILAGPYNQSIKLRVLFPDLWAYRIEQTPQLLDLLPSASLEILGERAQIWARAIAVLKDNWLFGISDGGFRMINGEVTINNTHSIVLQPLIDAGIIGFTVLLMLFVRIYTRIANPNIKTFFNYQCVTIAATLLLDFQVDHSLPWIICVSFLLSLAFASSRGQTLRFNVLEKGHFLARFLPVLTLLTYSVGYLYFFVKW